MSELNTIRHSFAHLLAQGLQRFVDPAIQLGTWPSIDNGFYYDVLFSQGKEFGEKDLKDLSKYIKQICKEPQRFIIYECPLQEGYQINDLSHQKLKNELLDKFADAGETDISYYLNVVPKAVLENMKNSSDAYITMYQNVTSYFQNAGTIGKDEAVVFIDLCTGPHITDMKEDLDPSGMKIHKLAGAYRQADENNVMMTRVYWLAFQSKDSLIQYEAMMKEARKRDHRILGQQLNLYSISELVWSWFPLMHPNGMIIRQEIENFLWELHKDRWYQRVWTPHLAKVELYKISGHYEHYKEKFSSNMKGRRFYGQTNELSTSYADIRCSSV